MSRIVVGYDGSEAAKTALTWAALQAKSRNATLRVVHVVAPAVASDGFGYVVPVDVEVFQVMLQSASKALDEALATTRAAHPALSIESEVRSGSASAELIKESEDADMVVIGSRGLGGFRGLLMGSVSTQVATHGVAPTVVLRKEAGESGGPVVVGIDGSELSNEALAFGFEYASLHALPLHVVHAWDVPTVDLVAVPASTFEALTDFENAEARAAAESLVGYSDKYPDVQVKEVIQRGSPITTLLDVGKHASLLVLGSRGHGEFVGAVLGSVSQAVLHRAHVPVAVVPHRTTRSEER